MDSYLTLNLLHLLTISVTCLGGTGSAGVTREAAGGAARCRLRQGYVTPQRFFAVTADQCFRYLFPRKTKPRDNDTATSSRDREELPTRENTCISLNSDECLRLKMCISDAEKCCKTQAKYSSSRHEVTGGSRVVQARGDLHGIQALPGTKCPMTWDGYACWSEQRPATKSNMACPTFISHATVLSATAEKICTENGTWYVDPGTGNEWTNYTSCLDVKTARRRVLIILGCHVISLCAQVPSIFVFLSYRSLRVQNRIKLHIQLFLSLTIYSVVVVVWEGHVVYDQLSQHRSSSSATQIHQNTVFCRSLNYLTRYCRMVTYFWMLCEGFYLHRLIAHAFKSPVSLKSFYAFAWGFPVIPTTIYASFRVYHKHNSCWVKNFSYFEWILYTPNIVCLVLNLVFLCDIIRIIMTQIQAHPNEPNNFRRGIRTTCILVPLFGLQSFLVIYRPPSNFMAQDTYEEVTSVIKSLQSSEHS